MAITKTTYKVSFFLSMMKRRSLELNPIFQRRAVWSKGAKSYLIDTIIRGLPMPLIMLRDKKTDLSSLEPKIEVVDGQQRIRTVISFIDPKLVPNMKKDRDIFTISSAHNKDLADKEFKELDDDAKQKILDYEFSVHIFSSSVSDREILDIFSRINSSGYRLNRQELRNARHFGEFKGTMYKLASEQLSRWRDWGIFSEDNIARMEEVELTSDMANNILHGLSERSQPSLDRLYVDKDPKFPEKSEVMKRFRETMDTIADVMEEKWNDSSYQKKTLFPILFIYIYDKTYGLGSKLKNVKSSGVSDNVIKRIANVDSHFKNKSAPTKVLEAASKRTTHLKNRKTLLDYFEG